MKTADTIAAVTHLLDNNLHFRVSVTLPELKQILFGFQRYNEIPANLPDIIKDLEKLNPDSLDRYEIGNEYSLVIYISKYVKSSGLNSIALAKQIERIGHKYNADEVDATAELTFVKARFWWD